MRTFILTIVALAVSWCDVPLSHAGGFTLSTEEVRSAREGVRLSHGWVYHSGDDPLWADPDYDDGDWQLITAKLLAPPHEGRGDWSGIGWFRLRFEVQPELRDNVLMVCISQLASAEYFLDGEPITQLGTIDPTGQASKRYLADMPVLVPVNLDERPEHVLAVRFANTPGVAYRFTEHPTLEFGGFDIAMADPHLALQTWIEIAEAHTELHIFAAAAALAICIIHLLLFAFFRRQTRHLFYALFTLFAAMIAYIPMKFGGTTDPEVFVAWARAFQFALAAVSVTGIRFLYSVFYERLPKFFWLWLVLGVIVPIAFWNGPIRYVFYFNLLTFVEILRVLALAVARKKPYAGLIAIGVATFILASATEIVANVVGSVGGPEFYLYGMLIMLIIMSVSLALGYAQINRELATRLDEVKKLSAERLENERVAKEQEIERMRLQADNALKATELEEAHKRQKVLDELEATNRELRQTQSQLVQSEKMAALGTLVAGVAHEINTPVGAISSMHDTLTRAVGKLRKLVDTTANDGAEATLKVIEDASDVIRSGSARVTTIVRRLRSFARLDEAELKTVDIHEGLEDTLTIVHHELKHHVTVHREYGPIRPVACYPGQLNQVFLNLLINAEQAIEGKGDITIKTYEKDNNVFVEISDTGKGIPPENLAKIFDPGFTTKGVGVGTGLGLSICYQIVESHRGQLLVDSRVGKGTTFTVVLPTDLE